MSTVKIDNLTVEINSKKILDDVSFSVSEQD